MASRARSSGVWKIAHCNRQYISDRILFLFRGAAYLRLLQPCGLRSLSPAITTRSFLRLAGQWSSCWNDWASSSTFIPSKPAAARCMPTPASAAKPSRQAKRFVRLYQDAETVVIPSSSCVAMIRDQYPGLFEELGNEELRRQFAALLPARLRAQRVSHRQARRGRRGRLFPASRDLPCQLPRPARTPSRRPALRAC